MKKHSLILVILFVAVLLTPAFSFGPGVGHGEGLTEHCTGDGPGNGEGYGPHHGPGPNREGHHGDGEKRGPRERFKEELNLTDKQLDEIKALKDDLGYEMEKIQLDIKLKDIEIAKLILADKISTSKVKSKIKEGTQFHTKIKEMTFDNFLKTMEVLDKDQKEKFKEIFTGRYSGKRKGKREKFKKKMKKKRDANKDKKEKYKTKMKKRYMEHMGLTQEQADKLEKSREAHKEDVKKIHNQIKIKREELSKIIQEDKISEKKVKAKFKEISYLHTKIELSRFDNFMDNLKILNKDQQRMFKLHYVKRHKRDKGAMKKKMKQRMKNKHRNKERHGKGQEPTPEPEGN
ncbi:periplasmic heavy metal sensor [Candidatus Dependentiae bacterium]|nr:periplasmic heavy metal sensor [Candidatus Dependentiae bacterium]